MILHTAVRCMTCRTISAMCLSEYGQCHVMIHIVHHFFLLFQIVCVAAAGAVTFITGAVAWDIRTVTVGCDLRASIIKTTPVRNLALLSILPIINQIHLEYTTSGMFDIDSGK